MKDLKQFEPTPPPPSKPKRARAAKKLPTKIYCGDWHRGWGLSGNDKIGIMRVTDLPGVYEWSGYSRGRHGGVWNRKAKLRYRIASGTITSVEHIKGEGPGLEDVRKAIIALGGELTTKD